ncbi:MAG: hypothetical protein RR547_01055 [Raoultibacter sp.]
MSRKNRFARCGTAALAIILSACLTLFALPMASLADTSVSKNSTQNPNGDAQPRVSQDVALVEAPDGKSSNTDAPEATVSADDSATQAQPTPQQTTAEVSVDGDGALHKTVLVDGLEYRVNTETATASLVGWYGEAPSGDLVIPSQVFDDITSYSVVALGDPDGVQLGESIDSNPKSAGGGAISLPLNSGR